MVVSCTISCTMQNVSFNNEKCVLYIHTLLVPHIPIYIPRFHSWFVKLDDIDISQSYCYNGEEKYKNYIKSNMDDVIGNLMLY